MQRNRYFLTLFIVALWLCASATNISPKQLIFKTVQPVVVRGDRTGLSAFDSYLNSLGARNMRPITGMPSAQYFTVNLVHEPDWDIIMNGRYAYEGIEYIQPNFLREMYIEPNDPLYSRLQHSIVSLPQAWNLTTGSQVVTIGIIDSGIMMEHPDLAANIYVNENEIPDNGIDDDNNGYIDDWRGWDFCDAPELADQALGDFLNPDNDATDENYHGTHVAGIAGAVGNNALGVCGVAWTVRLMPIRAGFRTTGGQGYLQDDDAAASIIYAADMGCSVINMSWGDPSYSPIIADACEYAYSRGTTLVASSGNTYGPNLSYPAKLSTVISVGSINRARLLSSFSSFGVDLDLVAPGELVLSTYKTTPGELYIEQSGTSMSAPYVTGAVALLKSIRPDLSPEEVRSRLLNSTDDLGDLGFDTRYGHGLLNVRKLLENTNPPMISISYPLDMEGINSAFQITGSIQGDNFLRYSVMRSSKAVPAESDWRNVHDDTSLPYYYYDQVQDGVLAHFNIPDHLPEGKYLIRVQFRDTAGRNYNYYRSVVFDNSFPELKENSLQGFERYDAQNLRFYVSAKFNEPVRSFLNITGSDGSLFHSYSATQDSLQIWALPSTIPPGPITIQITATNQSGLEYQGPPIPGFMDIQYYSISSFGYEKNFIGTGRVPLAKTHDFNGNSYPEYVSMDLPTTGYGRVRAFEPRSSGHSQTFDFNDNFQPLAIGSTSDGSIEMLGLKNDRAYLRKRGDQDIYPNTIAWQDSSISGGTMANFTTGNTGILLVKNLTTENVIQTYQRNSVGTMVPRNTLRNTTSTSLRNTFAPTIIVENLDQDAFPDILCADTDGDVLIFEVLNANNQQLAWTRRLPVANTYQLSAGDFLGNGQKQFIVGGYYTSILNPDMNFWYFEGFRAVGNNNYSSMGSIMFNNVQSQNAIYSADLDNDGSDEVILALSPNLYVIKYVENKWIPQFYGESYQTFRIGAYSSQDNDLRFLTNYRVAADTTVCAEWKRSAPFTGPATPFIRQVIPEDAHSVRLAWLDTGAEHYLIYQKNPDGSISHIATVDSLEYIAGNLVESSSYHFAVSAYDSSFSPPESVPSLWREAIPFRKPVLISIQMVGNNEIRLIFDQPIANDAVNPAYYHVDRGIGMPTSVNQVANQFGIQLRFSNILSQEMSPYTLTFSNVRGKTGSSPALSVYEFSYIADTDSPRVVSAVAASDHRSFWIKFNEQINPIGVSTLSNYRFTTPITDSENSLVSASAADSTIIVQLRYPLRYSNQSYYVEISGISDLAGNLLSPQYNIARIELRDITDLSRLKVFPNPISGSVQHWLTFVNFPENHRGRIGIFDSSGALVYSSSIGPFNTASNNTTWRWNLVNNSGLKVSSGIYYYVIEMDGMTKRGQIAVVK